MTNRLGLCVLALLIVAPLAGLAQTASEDPGALSEVQAPEAPALEAPSAETVPGLPATDDTVPRAPQSPETQTREAQSPEALTFEEGAAPGTGPGVDTTDAEPQAVETGVTGLQPGTDAPALPLDEAAGLPEANPGALSGEGAAASQTPDTLGALGAADRAREFLTNGGPALWAIAALSVITLALIFWKIWRLALAGAWSRGQAAHAVEVFEREGPGPALAVVDIRRGIRSQVMATTLRCLDTMSVDVAREETARVAKRRLGEARVGLGALELISTVAPLLGLLGTVLGMIAAFQALQAAGSRADPTLLAGGIWEALLTTAAGMAVAIPASAALTWFEAVIERMRQDIEDNATRLFVSTQSDKLALAAQ
ncbi:MAG: MotA/TolQ/ExbB proton channel family protein [Pseudomonadota bacterium]